MIGSRVGSQRAFVEVEDLASAAIALGVREDLPPVPLQAHHQLVELGGLEVRVAERARRNPERAAAEL